MIKNVTVLHACCNNPVGWERGRVMHAPPRGGPIPSKWSTQCTHLQAENTYISQETTQSTTSRDIHAKTRTIALDAWQTFN
jgi:hypothetical protein